MLEKIEVFYGPTKFGDTTPVYHKYIIYTNSNGDRYYARGGPGNYGPGAQNGKDVSSSPFGPIDTEHGKYEVDTPDWDSDNNNPSEFIKEGNDLTQDWKNITDAMDRLKDVELPYLLDSRNSNSAVDFALRESGLREPQRDGIDELWSPGSGDLKLLSPMELYFWLMKDRYNLILSDANELFLAAMVFIQRYDPLALDLDSDGVETISANSGIIFDFDGDGLKPVLFMRALKVTHFRQLDDPLTVFGLEGTIFGSVFTLSA